MQAPIDGTADGAEGVFADIQRKYWAAKPYFDRDYAHDALDQVSEHFVQYRTNGVGETIWRAWRMFHSMNAEGFTNDGGYPVSSPQYVGEQGEFIYTDVNTFRNTVLHQKALVTSDRPAFQAVAATSDAESMRQVTLAGHVLDYAMDQRRLAEGFDELCETALVMGAAFMMLSWDPYRGDSVPGGGGVKTGDLAWHVATPLEVVHQRVREYQEADWVIVRTFASRYSLAAHYANRGKAEVADEILKSSFTEADYQFSPIQIKGTWFDEEHIPVYHVYHRDTAAVPGGRYSQITGDGLVLIDQRLPWPEIPVYRMCPHQFLGTAVPYANAWDLMALHDLYNASLSPLVSRMDAYANPFVAIQQGTEWGPEGMTGYGIMEVPPGSAPPQLVDLYQFPVGVDKLMAIIKGDIGELSGINSVTRGAPADNITSGSMAALVEAQATKFNSALAQSFTYALEAVATGVIQLYQSMANHEMLIALAGESAAPTVEKFTGDSLERIKKVTVQRTNALTKTFGWRVDAANNMAAQGLLDNREEYMQVMLTGQTESMFTSDTNRVAGVHAENGRLLRLEPVPVLETDAHLLHLKEHYGVLDGPEVRANPELANHILAHIMEHFQVWMKVTLQSPQLLAPTNTPPCPLPMTPGSAAIGAAPSAPAPGGGGSPPNPAPKGGNDADGQVREPQMPSMPKNPATGEEN